MKKYFKPLLLFASAMGALFSFDVYGQMPQLPPIPVDSAVRIGHLDNGLTYYIRHNEYPKGQADRCDGCFRLRQDHFAELYFHH